MNDEQLLAEVEDLLRTSPPQSAFMEQENDEVLNWLGRAAAVLREWDSIQSALGGLESHLRALQARPIIGDPHGPAYRGLRTLLFQAQHNLRMKTVGPLSIAIDAKQPFVYFDEIRKIVEQAREDLLFVDPYLDSAFVSRYLPQVNKEVLVRLLASKKISALVSAVEVFVEEHKLQVQVRFASDFHDRFVFVDKTSCYLSGASFKDGAKKALTTLSQITDGLEAMLQRYEDMWDGAKIERG